MNDKIAFWAKSHTRSIGVTITAACSVAALQCMISGGQLSPATAALLADPLSILSGRSPGSRASGALLQSKQAYASTVKPGNGNVGVPPSERVLANVRTRPVEPLSETDTNVLPALPNTDALIPEEGVTAFPSGSPVFGGGGVGGFPGTVPAGGGGGGGGGGGNSGAIPSVPTAVPEPATWAFMLTGYFFIGMMYRRRRVIRATNSSTEPASHQL